MHERTDVPGLWKKIACPFCGELVDIDYDAHLASNKECLAKNLDHASRQSMRTNRLESA